MSPPIHWRSSQILNGLLYLVKTILFYSRWLQVCEKWKAHVQIKDYMLVKDFSILKTVALERSFALSQSYCFKFIY